MEGEKVRIRFRICTCAGRGNGQSEDPCTTTTISLPSLYGVDIHKVYVYVCTYRYVRTC